jgi:hypothetical protein
MSDTHPSAEATRRKVSYQAMAQPRGQNITVTFADGTTFTARYAGSGLQSMREGTFPYSCITLHMITEMDAEIIDPTLKRCGAVRTAEQFAGAFPDADPDADPDDSPCILLAGHPRTHIDADGDAW